MPAKGADRDELLSLAAVVGEHEGTTLEGIFAGASAGFDDEEVELMAALSVAADRILNWNVLVVDAASPERIEAHLAAVPGRPRPEAAGSWPSPCRSSSP